MKKLYALLFIFIVAKSFAQTITQGDMPFAGLAWTSGVDTNYTDPISAGGAAQTWNYSTLVTEYVDTSGFQNAAGTPHVASFPTATLAAKQSGSTTWVYYTSAATGFYINGLGTDTGDYAINPPQMYVPVPFSYGDSHTDISRLVVFSTYMGAPAEVIFNFNGVFHADGYGTLTTPAATYPSTLRVKQVMLETDSLLVDPLSTGTYIFVGRLQTQRTHYRWFQHGGTANYILGIDGDSLGNFGTKSDYVLQWVVLSDNDLTNASSLNVFPNPANERLLVNGKLLSGKTTIRVYDAPGKTVYQSEQDFSSASGQLEISTAKLTEGIYFYSIVSAEKHFNGKFTVMH